MVDERTDRAEYLREHLAALEGYGNGNGARASAIRQELEVLDTAAAKRRRKTAKTQTVTEEVD